MSSLCPLLRRSTALPDCSSAHILNHTSHHYGYNYTALQSWHWHFVQMKRSLLTASYTWPLEGAAYRTCNMLRIAMSVQSLSDNYTLNSSVWYFSASVGCSDGPELVPQYWLIIHYRWDSLGVMLRLSINLVPPHNFAFHLLHFKGCSQERKHHVTMSLVARLQEPSYSRYPMSSSNLLQGEQASSAWMYYECLHVLSVKPQGEKGFSLICCVFFLVNHTVEGICIKLQTLLLFLHLYSSSILSSPSKLNDPFISWWPTEALRWLCLGMCLCECVCVFGRVWTALRPQLHVKFTVVLIL